jgi:hypothetical protein
VLDPRPSVAPHTIQPCRALVAQQGAADPAGIIAQACADDLVAFGMLGAADPISQEASHVSGDGWRIGGFVEFEDGVDARAAPMSAYPHRG